jgi:hypothetical protein
MAILPESRYDDIRVALDPTLGPVAMPSEVIGSFMYLGKAERWALTLDPLAETRTGAEQEALHEAIVYYTASLLSRVIPQARQVNMAGHTATFVYGETAAERTERLLGAANDAIATYLTTTEEFGLEMDPLFVTTVSGQRG